MVKAAAEANNYLTNADLVAAMAAIPTPDGPTAAPEGVVKGQFAGRLKPNKRAAQAQGSAAVPLDYLKNMDAHLADIEAGRKPKLA